MVRLIKVVLRRLHLYRYLSNAWLASKDLTLEGECRELRQSVSVA